MQERVTAKNSVFEEAMSTGTHGTHRFQDQLFVCSTEVPAFESDDSTREPTMTRPATDLPARPRSRCRCAETCPICGHSGGHPPSLVLRCREHYCSHCALIQKEIAR